MERALKPGMGCGWIATGTAQGVQEPLWVTVWRAGRSALWVGGGSGTAWLFGEQEKVSKMDSGGTQGGRRPAGVCCGSRHGSHGAF